MINRRLVRESVLKTLYAGVQSGDSTQYVVDTILKSDLRKDKENLRFAEKLFFTTWNKFTEFDEIITNYIKNWEIDRLALIDRLVLRMALCELMYFDDIPTKVSINEAIEIVKKYSTAKSGKFINGILDAAVNDLIESGKIKKQGRGLINESLNN